MPREPPLTSATLPLRSIVTPGAMQKRYQKLKFPALSADVACIRSLFAATGVFMATAAAIADSNPSLGLDPAGVEVRIWGMDQDDKPFIQSALARHITDKGALLTGVLPVKMGDVVGVRYLERKARFKITWLSDQDSSQT